MEEVKYTKVVDMEKAEASYPPPPPSPPKYEDSASMQGEGPGPANPRLLQSLLASFLCCFPAGFLGVLFGMKTYLANKAGDFVSARKFSKWAKRFIILAVVFGSLVLVASVAMQVGVIVRELHKAKHSFREGLVSGIADGKAEGAQFAMDHFETSAKGSLVLPEPIPMDVNVFDLRRDNPFWVEVRQAFQSQRPYEAAIPFGYQFGWAHGFKTGFCDVEGTNCTGVVLSDHPCPFRAVFGNWKRWKKHHKCGLRFHKHRMD